MGTVRSTLRPGSAPTTDFYLEADVVETQKYGAGNGYGRWRVRFYIRAVNRGNTSSYMGSWGYHSGYYAYVYSPSSWTRFRQRAQQPFLPSGYGTGATRWHDGPYYAWINANSNGYVNGSSTTLHLLQDVQGDSDWGYISARGSLTLPRIAQPPTAARSLTIGTVKDTSVALSWTAPSDNRGSGITGYRIQYSTTSNFSSNVTTIEQSGTGTSRTVTGLTKRKQYWFRVYAKNGVGYGGASNTVNTTTIDVPDQPPAPVGNVIQTTEFSYNATNPSYTGGTITDREVQRATNPTFTSGLYTSSFPGTTTSGSFTGLTRATPYYVRQRVKNSIGWSEWSPTGIITTLVSKPSKPIGYFVTDIAGTSALLNLGSVADTGGSPLAGMKYEVRRTSTLTVVDSQTLPYYSSSWIKFPWEVGDVGGVNYQVRMAVLNSGAGAQWSDWGDWLTFTSVVNVPSEVRNVTTVSKTETTAKVSWDAPEELGGASILYYLARVSLNPQGLSGFVEYTVSSGGPGPYEVEFTGLQPGTPYYVLVTPISSNGPGSKNVPAHTFTTDGTPVTPDSFWMRIAGMWRPGKLYLKVSGTWRPVTMWQRIGGGWRKF